MTGIQIVEVVDVTRRELRLAWIRAAIAAGRNGDNEFALAAFREVRRLNEEERDEVAEVAS